MFYHSNKYKKMNIPLKKLISGFLTAMVIVLFPFHVLSQNKTASSKIDPALESQIKEINKITARLETQIDSNLLFPFIESKINYSNPTEGVPPEIRFYFNDKNLLTAAEIHVGFETWGKTFYYFFDEKEKIMKYLCVIQGGPAGPGLSKERSAVIFNPEGKIIWKNMDDENIGLEKILKLFKLLRECEDSFSH